MAGIETQLLSPNESFAWLPWMVWTVSPATFDEQPPYLLRYYAFDPSKFWNMTGDGSSSPLSLTGALHVSGAGRIYSPD